MLVMLCAHTFLFGMKEQEEKRKKIMEDLAISYTGMSREEVKEFFAQKDAGKEVEKKVVFEKPLAKL